MVPFYAWPKVFSVAIGLVSDLEAGAPEGVSKWTVFAMQYAAELVVLADSVEEALIALNIGREESGFDRCAVGPPGVVGGTVCSVGQILDPGMWGSSCARMCEEPYEAARVQLAVIRAAVRQCASDGGTWEDALTSYVSGHCGWARSVAHARCAKVRLCEATP